MFYKKVYMMVLIVMIGMRMMSVVMFSKISL